jgi:hypothetical protein
MSLSTTKLFEMLFITQHVKKVTLRDLNLAQSSFHAEGHEVCYDNNVHVCSFVVHGRRTITTLKYPEVVLNYFLYHHVADDHNNRPSSLKEVWETKTWEQRVLRSALPLLRKIGLWQVSTGAQTQQ